jgi:hypothetical protein
MLRKITSHLNTADQLGRFQRRYVDVHPTDFGDGDSAECEVILMISFVICHDKQARGGEGRAKWGMSFRMERRSKVNIYVAVLSLVLCDYRRFDGTCCLHVSVGIEE